MDSIADILANKNFDKPDEVSVLQQYIEAKYKQKVVVKIQNNNYIISSPSSGLITNLKLNSHELSKLIAPAKTIRFVIG